MYAYSLHSVVQDGYASREDEEILEIGGHGECSHEERERERERDLAPKHTHKLKYIYIYSECLVSERERE